jgi:hypothetical protein
MILFTVGWILACFECLKPNSVLLKHKTCTGLVGNRLSYKKILKLLPLNQMGVVKCEVGLCDDGDFALVDHDNET